MNQYLISEKELKEKLEYMKLAGFLIGDHKAFTDFILGSKQPVDREKIIGKIQDRLQFYPDMEHRTITLVKGDVEYLADEIIKTLEVGK